MQTITNQLYKLKSKTTLVAVTLTLLIVSCNEKTNITSTEPVSQSRNSDIIQTPIQKNTFEDFDPSSLKEISHNIPDGIDYKGEIQNAYTWNDKNGENILLNYVEILEKEKRDEDGTFRGTYLTGLMYSMHYVNTGKEYILMFENKESVPECIYELVTEFLSTPVIVDSDNNGFAEVAVCWRYACMSDMSPANLAVVMHENKTRYTLQGFEYLVGQDSDKSIPLDFQYDQSIYEKEESKNTVLGRYHDSNEFTNAPKSFFPIAEKMWKENAYELRWDFKE